MPRFRRRYEHLDKRNKERADQAVRQISTATDPSALGKYKRQFKAFSYEIGRKYRIIYIICNSTKTVKIASVCDHKSVYGRG